MDSFSIKHILIVLFGMLIPHLAFAQVVVNGDFESGRNVGWIEHSSSNYTLIGTGNFFSSTEIQPPVLPRSGNWMARLGGYSYENNTITQTVNLQSSPTLYFVFYSQTRSASTSECAGLWVGAKVSLTINGQVITSSYLCQYNDLTQWTKYYVDVSAIAGQSATIVFGAESANSVWSYIYFDDISLTTTVGVEELLTKYAPASFHLEQNYPNPFNPSTTIRYQLPKAARVSLKVYNLLGQLVAALVDEEKQAGYYQIQWSTQLPAGIYFYQLHAGEFTETKKLLLIR